jgi:hypothetical protein
MAILYGNLIDATLKLIDEYSRKGTEVPTAKTADYRLKIPEAINAIQQDLAYGPGRLIAEITISNSAATQEEEYEPLPTDWFRVMKVMQRRNNRHWVPFYDYRINSNDFVYSARESGDILITYFRRPTAVTVGNPVSPTAAELAQPIDVVPEAEFIVPLGVAGMILAGDDNNQSTHFLNLYESRKYMLPQPEDNFIPYTIPNITGW